MLTEIARPAAVSLSPTGSPPAGQKARLAQLRDRLVALEAGSAARAGVAFLGAPELEERLPGGGLAIAGLHQIAPERLEADAPAAAGFALALAAALKKGRKGPVFWISTGLLPYPPGLFSFGLDPADFLFVAAKGQVDLLWATEEILRSRQASVVLSESAALDRTAQRRLQLAAEGSATPCLLIERRASEGASPALTRWQVAAAPSGLAEADDLPGPARWRLSLTRSRGGTAPHDFLVEWDDAAGAFALASRLRDGAFEAHPSEGARRTA